MNVNKCEPNNEPKIHNKQFKSGLAGQKWGQSMPSPQLSTQMALNASKSILQCFSITGLLQSPIIAQGVNNSRSTSLTLKSGSLKKKQDKISSEKERGEAETYRRGNSL